MSSIAPGYCHCGCGQKTPLATRNRNGYKKGEPIKFIRGHIGKINSIETYHKKLSQLDDGTIVKKCTMCQIPKPLDQFSKSKSRPEKRRAHCKECEKQKAKEFYHKNPKPYKKRAALWRDKMRDFYTKFLNDLKTNAGCAFCGEKTLCVLHFHHHAKGKPVYNATGRGRNALQKELDKCAVVCANCHERIHGGLLEIEEKMLLQISVPCFWKGHSQ